ncbi:YqzH family protein [Bacillus sp. LL01]|uniref:YqzH family protein n=1 Tax=Bacillus sp. LL01 TaxID=1665556 RepID=UPI0009E46CFF|nr:YqzH family protein [Bacillus sp. LL01]
MIRNCFVQYQHDFQSIPLSEEEYEKMVEEVNSIVAEGPESDVFEVVNDVVYEYLSK